MDSKELVILKKLTAWLQGVTPGNGYDYDLSTSVFRGRTLYGAGDPIPMLSLLEAPKPDVGLTAGDNKMKRNSEWLIFLQGWAPDDKDNPTDPAYNLKAAAEKRLSEIILLNAENGQPANKTIYMLPGADGRPLIANLGIGPGVVRPPDNQVSSSKAFFFTPLRIELITDVSSPYAS